MKKLASLIRLATPALLAALAAAPVATAQVVGYSHDDNNRLVRVTNAAGGTATYVYDSVGNLLSITNSTGSPTALAVYNFTPQQGAPGTIVTVQGQNFNATAASDVVRYNGVTAQVLSATATSLVTVVPAVATTGPISVMVGGATAASATNFIVSASPVVTQITPTTVMQNNSAQTIAVQVSGAGLNGSTFSFAPAYSPDRATVTSATISADGSSATLQVLLAASVSGTYTLVASNGAGSSNVTPTATNTLQVLSVDDDSDSDGLTNGVEFAIGTNALNPATSGQGIGDGWQVFYGLNPLSAASAGPDPGGSGYTVARDFSQNLSPLNPNRVPPSVVQVTPAAGGSTPVNNSIIVRFGEPLLTGVTYQAASNAISTAIGTNTTLSAGSLSIAATTLQNFLNRTCCGTSALPTVVSLSGPFGVVPGAVAASSDGLSLTFKPIEPLVSNTNYSVTVSGARDAAGNVMTAAYTSTFNTNAMVDSTVPAVKLVDPENGLTGVPTNAHYTVQFTKVVDPSTLSATSFSIQDTTSNTLVAGMIQVDPSGTTASFIPSQPLPIAHNFTVTLTPAITDSEGNPLAATMTKTFTTGYVPETTPPHFVASSPIAGSQSVATNALVDLLFSQPIDISKAAANLSVTANGQPVAVQIAFSNGDMRATLTPSASLQAGTQFSVTLGAALLNLAGYALDNPGSFTFTTGTAPDTTSPSVVSYAPLQYAVNMPLNTLIRFGFNKPVDGTTVLNGGFTLTPCSGNSQNLVAGALVLAADQKSLTFTPSALLIPGSCYIAEINALDLEGNRLSGSTNFNTGTASSTQTGGPSVTLINPPAGSTGIPVNPLIQASFNEDIAPVSVNSAITLTGGGQTISGTVSQPYSTTSVLQFAPATALQPSTAYTITIGGVADLAGNTGPTFTSSFTTSGATTAASGFDTLLSSSPSNGATAVPVTTAITLSFTTAINPVSVNTSSLLIKANGTEIAGTYAVNGATITFAPLTPLPGGAAVVIQISTSYYSSVGQSGTLQDIAGNNVGYQTVSFTTAATQDTTAPTVVSVSPQNGQTGIGTGAQVVIVFSKSMNPATLTTSTIGVLAKGASQYESPSISADNRTLTLATSNLPASSLVTVTISSGATDLSGNALAPFETQFTTGSLLDTSHASVVNQRPANGATQVAATVSPIVLFLSKPLNPSSISANTVQVAQNGQPVQGTLAVMAGGEAISFTPAAAFTPGALIQVYLDNNALDTSGNTVYQYSGMFTIAGAAATSTPALLSGTPLSGDTGVPTNVVVTRQFSAQIDPATVTSANVYLYQSSTGAISGTASLDATGTIVRLQPTALLKPNTAYLLSIQVKGVNGLYAEYQYAGFTTGAGPQTTAPTIVSYSPMDGVGNVPLNGQVSVLFSGAVDPTTVNASTITLTGGGVTEMPSTIAFSNSGRRAVVTPQAVLPPSTVMTLTISGITDAEGNAIAAQTTHFTTGVTAATSGSAFISVNPGPQATGVPLNTVVSLQANTPIDPTSLNSSSFALVDYALNQVVGGTYSVSADGMTAFFTPSAPLAAGRVYSLQLNYYSSVVTDLAGNTFSCSYVCSVFTTGFATSSTAPQVTGITPASAATAAPLNSLVQVSFSEGVDAQMLAGVTLSTNGSPVAITTTLGSGAQLLTITPTAGLQANTTYTLSISGVQDLSGNTMAGTVASSFRTGALPDLAALNVVLVSPASGSANVPLNAQVRFSFNKPVNQVARLGANPITLGSYNYSYSYVVPGSVSFSADGMTATFIPASNLNPDTLYQASITGLVDLEGNALTAIPATPFTTGSSTQTSGPSVVAISPANGSVTAPVNTQVELAFNEPIGSVLLGGTVTVSSGGQAVAGTVTLPTPTTLLFTPAVSLSAQTTYSVALGTLVDVAGNPAASFTSMFATGPSTAPASSAPTLVASSPASGNTGVAVNSQIVLTFSAPLNPLSVTAQSIAVRAYNNTTYAYGEIAGTFTVDGAVVTFTPGTPLPGNSTISVQFPAGSYPTDLAGNKSGYGNVSFYTAATADTTLPTVVSITPTAGQTGVGLSGQVVIFFSKSINPSTLVYPNIAVLAADMVQNFQVAIAADNRSVTLSVVNMPPSSLVTVSLSGAITDLSGNALAPYVSQFTTGPAQDGTHAKVTGQRPASGATGVSLAASPITVFVTKPLNPSSVNSSTVQVTQNGQVVSGTLALAGNGQTIEFTPSAPWTYGALVQVFLSANILDTGSTAITAYTGSFTVVGNPATTAPVVLNMSPALYANNVPLNAVLDIQYSGPIDPSTVTTQNLTVQTANSNSTVPGTASLDSTGTILHFTPTAGFAANTSYYYNQQNLRGTDGLAVSTQYFYFTTGAVAQSMAPTVVAVNPPNQLTNVPINADLAVLFSAPIDPITFNATTVTLSGGGSSSLPASISFSNSNQRAQLTPEAPLPANTLLSLALSGITDPSGNTVAQQTTQFTTGSVTALTAPAVTVVSPSASETGVPLNASVSLQATAAIDPTTVNAVTFPVIDQSINQHVAGTYSLSPDYTSLYFLPSVALAASHTFAVSFTNSGIQDLAGNVLGSVGCDGCLNNYTFTTGTTPGVTPPAVTGVSPAAAQAGVPVNAQVVFAFSEPVNPESLQGVTLSSAGNAVPYTFVLSSGNELLTVTPSSGLNPGTTYTLTANGVADLSGNSMTSAFTSTFTTGPSADASTNKVTSTVPANGATGVVTTAPIRVRFSKLIDPLTLTSQAVTLTTGNTPVSATLALDSTGTVLTITPSAPLAKSTSYTLALSYTVLDLEGNQFSGTQVSFTTGAN